MKQYFVVDEDMLSVLNSSVLRVTIFRLDCFDSNDPFIAEFFIKRPENVFSRPLKTLFLLIVFVKDDY